MGIVDPKDLHAGQVHSLERLEVRLPVVLFQQIVGQDPRLDEPGGGSIGGVARIRHQYAVTRVEEGQGDEQDALFRADQGLDLAGRIEFHVIIAAIPSGESLAQLIQTHVTLVGVDVGFAGGFDQRFDGRGGRHPVRRADAQIDDGGLARRLPLPVERGDLFQLSGEIILPDRFGPSGGRDDHRAAVYSPSIRRSSMSGRTAERACR